MNDILDVQATLNGINLTNVSEGERSELQISSKIPKSMEALGYVELDYESRFLFSLEAVKQVYTIQ